MYQSHAVLEYQCHWCTMQYYQSHAVLEYQCHWCTSMRSGLTFTSTRMPTMGNPASRELQSDAQTHAACGATATMRYFKAEAAISAVSLWGGGQLWSWKRWTNLQKLWRRSGFPCHYWFVWSDYPIAETQTCQYSLSDNWSRSAISQFQIFISRFPW